MGHLQWAIIMVRRPALVGNLPWNTVLTSLNRHIYKGHEDMAHCLPFMLASWDCKEKIEALCHEGGLNTE